jgi:long-chain acyl-CoA synthetase
LQRRVDAVNAERSRYEQIKRFAILRASSRSRTDEVTPTLKLTRKVVLEHFAEEDRRRRAELSNRRSR